MTLTFGDEPENAAAALRDIEQRCPCHGAERRTRPLFADAAHQPYTHGYLNSMLVLILTFLYGAAVAALYTFHSYRSGLATALHAAHVPDAMIQLICRWMCPESLHVYRRMGTAEHERHVERAAHADVDLIQSTNVVRVVADEGYADLVEGLQGSRGRDAQRDYERARAAALGERVTPTAARRAPAATPARRSAERAPSSAAEAEASAPQAAPELAPLEGEPKVGDAVFVPREVWPSHACREHAGEGWAATVVATTKFTAVVRFTYARTADGRRYLDERLDWLGRSSYGGCSRRAAPPPQPIQRVHVCAV